MADVRELDSDFNEEQAEAWLAAEYERGYADGLAAAKGEPDDRGCPQPTDGPDYHADLAFWRERRRTS